MALNKAKDYEGKKGFDVDLEFGQHFEQLVDDLFCGRIKAEVKTERDKWKYYGNIVIELEYNGKPSGLTSTEAEIWVHLLSDEGRLVGGFILEVEVLRKIVKKMRANKIGRVTKGGDGYRSKLFLLPIDRLNEYIIKEAKGELDD